MGEKKLPSSFAFGCDCDVMVLNHEGKRLTSSQPAKIDRKDGKNHASLIMSLSYYTYTWIALPLNFFLVELINPII